MKSLEDQPKTNAAGLPANSNLGADQYRPPLGYADLGHGRGTGSAPLISPCRTDESASGTEHFAVATASDHPQDRRRGKVGWLRTECGGDRPGHRDIGEVEEPTCGALRIPILGSANVSVASALTTSPGASPDVTSSPLGVSNATTELADVIAPISSAARPVVRHAASSRSARPR